jgi:hypothetical protein
MKALLFLLLLAIAACAADDHPYDFGFTGNISITKATIWMDGGSITISLRDEHGTEAHAGYRNGALYGTSEHGDQFSFRRPTATKPVFFARRSNDEKALFDLLRTASNTTFGTSDPEQLKVPGDWNRLAMSFLFRAIARHTATAPK